MFNQKVFQKSFPPDSEEKLFFLKEVKNMHKVLVKDLINKIPKPLTTSHIAKGSLRIYNYKIVDFLKFKFNGKHKNWYEKN